MVCSSFQIPCATTYFWFIFPLHLSPFSTHHVYYICKKNCPSHPNRIRVFPPLRGVILFSGIAHFSSWALPSTWPLVALRITPYTVLYLGLCVFCQTEPVHTPTCNNTAFHSVSVHTNTFNVWLSTVPIHNCSLSSTVQFRVPSFTTRAFNSLATRGVSIIEVSQNPKNQ